jgi:hypothetical protein
MFSHPVDPVRDNLPDYSSKVTEPIDLGTVCAKLLAGQYQSVAAWCEDVDLIWADSFAVHARGTLMAAVTLEMETLFKRFSQHLTDNPDNDWLAQLAGLNHERACLPAPSSLTPKRDGSKLLVQRTQLLPRSPAERPKHHRKHQTSFTKSDLVKLAADINSLKDDTHVLLIFSIIKKYERNVDTDVDRLELDIAPLRIRTLNALREKVDSGRVQHVEVFCLIVQKGKDNRK